MNKSFLKFGKSNFCEHKRKESFKYSDFFNNLYIRTIVLCSVVYPVFFINKKIIEIKKLNEEVLKTWIFTNAIKKNSY